MLADGVHILASHINPGANVLSSRKTIHFLRQAVTDGVCLAFLNSFLVLPYT